MSDQNIDIAVKAKTEGATDIKALERQLQGLGKKLQDLNKLNAKNLVPKGLEAIGRASKKNAAIAASQLKTGELTLKSLTDQAKKVKSIYDIRKTGRDLTQKENRELVKQSGILKTQISGYYKARAAYTKEYQSLEKKVALENEKNSRHQQGILKEIGLEKARQARHAERQAGNTEKQLKSAAEKERKTYFSNMRYRGRVRMASEKAEESAAKKAEAAEIRVRGKKFSDMRYLSRVRAASEKAEAQHAKKMASERSKAFGRVTGGLSSAGGNFAHAAGRLDHPFFHSPVFVALGAIAAAGHIGHKSIEAAKDMDKSETLLRIRSLGTGANSLNSSAEGRAIRNEEIKRGLRMGVDPAQLMDVRSELIKQTVPKELSGEITEMMVMAAQAMHAPFEDIASEMGKVIAEGFTSGHIKNSKDVRSFVNSATGTVNNLAIQPHELMQFFDNGGMGSGKMLGMEEWQSLFMAGMLSSKGARNGRTASQMMKILGESQSDWPMKLRQQAGSTDPESVLFRQIPEKLGYAGFGDIGARLKSDPLGETISFFQKLGGVGDKNLRNQMMKVLGFSEHAHIIENIGSDKGEIQQKLKEAREIHGQTKDNDVLGKSLEEYYKSLTYFTNRVSVAWTQLQAAVGDALKDDFGAFSGEFTGMIDRIFDHNTIHNLMKSVVKGIYTGFGYDSFASMMHDTFGNVNGGLSDESFTTVFKFIKGFVIGMKESLSVVGGILKGLGVTDAETLGKLVGGMFALSLALHLLRPGLTVLGMLKDFVLVIVSLFAAFGGIAGLAGIGTAMGIGGAGIIGGTLAVAAGGLAVLAGVALVGTALAVAVMNWDKIKEVFKFVFGEPGVTEQRRKNDEARKNGTRKLPEDYLKEFSPGEPGITEQRRRNQGKPRIEDYIKRGWDGLFGITPGNASTPNNPMLPKGVAPGGGIESGPKDSPIAPFKGSQTFDGLAPRISADLQRDFGLNKKEAAMILGNLGHESVGMTAFQEKNPINGGRGGWGWAQWTGPRRRAFEKYAAERGLDPKSYEANYGYLRAELSGQIPGLNYKKSIDAIRGQTDLHQGIKDFENSFEKSDPRYKGYASRYKYGDRAMALPDAAGGSTAQASPSSSGAGKPTLPVPPSWTPSTSGRVGGASTSSMHAPITIQGGNQDPQAVADAVQRRIEDSMKWRTHDIDHQMT